jgi:hybrid cluster-associated redox disulfide protein
MTQKQAYILKKDALISDVVDECPKVIIFLAEYGLLCASCFLNRYDTLEKGAKIHHMSDVDIDKMIAEINEELKKEENLI